MWLVKEVTLLQSLKLTDKGPGQQVVLYVLSGSVRTLYEFMYVYRWLAE